VPKPLHPARRSDRNQAIAKSDELARALDVQLWRAERPGLDERFDAGRFGEWIEELMESGAEFAAQTLAAADVNLLVAGFAEHVRVFHLAAMVSVDVDGEERAAINTGDGPSCEIAGCLLVARRTESWDAIVDAMLALDTYDFELFHGILAGVRRLSNAGFEDDGLHDLLTDRDQAAFDLSIEREARRDEEGFVAPAPARAFLEAARHTTIGDGTAPSGDAESHALIASDSRPRLARLHAYLQRAQDRDADAFAARTQEIARLANTLVAGCSLQSRAFTPEEAANAAAAICNLGLENTPSLDPPSLEAVFQLGWTLLHERVCLHTARRLAEILGELHCSDREIHTGLDELREKLTHQCRAGSPWRAREAMDVLATLDMIAWAALLGLIDECPVMHAALSARDTHARAVSATAFEFISENRQIVSIVAFVETLPETLRGS